MFATELADSVKLSARKEDAWIRAVSALFFFSGFPALVYQLVWQRALFRIFGVNVESVTIVVTAFMIGLGIGSLAGGRLSRQSRMPLLPLLAAIELLTALFGVFSLSIFDAVDGLAHGLPLPATALVSLALVLVPTLLMGATLPILVGELSRRYRNTGRSMGLLYYVNTMGAGAACLAGVAVLFPFLGMSGSIYFAATINGAVAVGALIAHYHGVSPSAAIDDDAPATHASRLPKLSFPQVLVLAALAGFVSLSFEIFFFRLQSYATGGSAGAFGTTLGAFLIGIAAGSRRAGEVTSEASAEEAAREMLKVMLTGCLIGFLYLPVIDSVATKPALLLTVSLVMVVLVARAWGMILPFLAHLGIAADHRTGERVSYLYLANIAGSATGSILTGFVLMQHMTMVGIAQFLTIAGLACVALMWRAMGAERIASTRMLAAAAVASVIAIALLPRTTPLLLERLQFGPAAAAAVPFKRVVENRSGIITVDSDDTVWGHGMYDGKFNTDLTHDSNGLVRPYALSLFHPAPRQVLMIGLATGSWARTIASNPDVDKLTVIEINPGYIELIRERPEVSSILSDPKVEIIVDDGRRWLKMHPERKFDAVVSNTTWYFRANVTNLLSREFLSLVGDHLAPGGLFYYNTTSSPRAQRTACLTMPNALRFSNHMVVSNSPIDVDFDRWRKILLAYRVHGAPVVDAATPQGSALLDKLMGFHNEAMPANGSKAKMIESCPEILARTGGETPFTDDNMGSEWRKMLGFD